MQGIVTDPAGDGVPVATPPDAHLRDALAAYRTGDVRRASRALEQVLGQAEPDGLRRAFAAAGTEGRELLVAHLDSGTAHWSLVGALLAATGDRAVAGPAPALTARELTVLRYLQGLLSNEEIASTLCVSVNTVKTHVRNIYRKLDATRRRDAVRRARQLRLL